LAKRNNTTRTSPPRFVERFWEHYYFLIGQIDETRVERLGIRAGMIEQYMPIRRKRLNRRIEKKLALFDYKAEKELSALQDRFLSAEQIFKKKYAQKEDALNKQYHLKFREYRQRLRRAEGIVDADNNLTGELSSESAKKVDAYGATLEAEKRAIIQKAAERFIRKKTTISLDGGGGGIPKPSGNSGKKRLLKNETA
jgi:hypothetical protein